MNDFQTYFQESEETRVFDVPLVNRNIHWGDDGVVLLKGRDFLNCYVPVYAHTQLFRCDWISIVKQKQSSSFLNPFSCSYLKQVIRLKSYGNCMHVLILLSNRALLLLRGHTNLHGKNDICYDANGITLCSNAFENLNVLPPKLSTTDTISLLSVGGQEYLCCLCNKELSIWRIQFDVDSNSIEFVNLLSQRDNEDFPMKIFSYTRCNSVLLVRLSNSGKLFLQRIEDLCTKPKISFSQSFTIPSLDYFNLLHVFWGKDEEILLFSEDQIIQLQNISTNGQHTILSEPKLSPIYELKGNLIYFLNAMNQVEQWFISYESDKLEFHKIAVSHCPFSNVLGITTDIYGTSCTVCCVIPANLDNSREAQLNYGLSRPQLGLSAFSLTQNWLLSEDLQLEVIRTIAHKAISGHNMAIVPYIFLLQCKVVVNNLQSQNTCCLNTVADSVQKNPNYIQGDSDSSSEGESEEEIEKTESVVTEGAFAISSIFNAVKVYLYPNPRDSALYILDTLKFGIEKLRKSKIEAVIDHEMSLEELFTLKLYHLTTISLQKCRNLGETNEALFALIRRKIRNTHLHFAGSRIFQDEEMLKFTTLKQLWEQVKDPEKSRNHLSETGICPLCSGQLELGEYLTICSTCSVTFARCMFSLEVVTSLSQLLICPICESIACSAITSSKALLEIYDMQNEIKCLFCHIPLIKIE